MFQTVIANVSGLLATDIQGRNLIIAGNDSVMPGKAVWTDGKIIYGQHKKTGGSSNPVPLNGYLWYNEEGFFVIDRMADTVTPLNWDELDCSKLYYIISADDALYGVVENSIYNLLTGELAEKDIGWQHYTLVDMAVSQPEEKDDGTQENKKILWLLEGYSKNETYDMILHEEGGGVIERIVRKNSSDSDGYEYTASKDLGIIEQKKSMYYNLSVSSYKNYRAGDYYIYSNRRWYEDTYDGKYWSYIYDTASFPFSEVKLPHSGHMSDEAKFLGYDPEKHMGIYTGVRYELTWNYQLYSPSEPECDDLTRDYLIEEDVEFPIVERTNGMEQDSDCPWPDTKYLYPEKWGDPKSIIYTQKPGPEGIELTYVQQVEYRTLKEVYLYHSWGPAHDHKVLASKLCRMYLVPRSLSGVRHEEDGDSNFTRDYGNYKVSVLSPEGFTTWKRSYSIPNVGDFESEKDWNELYSIYDIDIGEGEKEPVLYVGVWGTSAKNFPEGYQLIKKDRETGKWKTIVTSKSRQNFRMGYIRNVNLVRYNLQNILGTKEEK